MVTAYIGSIEAIRDIRDALAPRVDALDSLKSIADDLVAGVASNVTQETRAALSEFSGHISAAMSRWRSERFLVAQLRQSGELVVGVEPPETSGLFELRFTEGSTTGVVWIEPATTVELKQAQLQLLFQSGMSAGRRDRGRTLYGALVVSAVTSFETLVGRVVGTYARTYPESIGSDEKEFSLVELTSFESLDEVVDAAVDRRVEGFLRRGWDHWSKWFDRHGNPFESVAMDLARTHEVYLRRNAIIHAEGLASAQYVQSLSAGIPAPAIGSMLDIDGQYVRRALDLLESFGTLLACKSWVSIVPGDESQVAAYLEQASFRSLQGGRWEELGHICNVAPVVATPSTLEMRQQYLINRLLAKKHFNGAQAIRSDLLQLNLDEFTPLMKLGVLALGNRFDELAFSCEKALADGIVTRKGLLEWPIFAEFRASEQFESLTS